MMLHYINEYPSEWEGFEKGRWCNTSVNVRDFIKKNYTPYDGDESFLAAPTEATKKLWEQVMDLSRQEREAGGVLDMDTKIVSTITSIGLDEAYQHIYEKHEYREQYRHNCCRTADGHASDCGKDEYQQRENNDYHVTAHHVGKQTDRERRRLGQSSEELYHGHDGEGKLEPDGNIGPEYLLPVMLCSDALPICA